MRERLLWQIFVSRPNGKKYSSVLCAGKPDISRENPVSRIQSWDWNLSGDKSTYNALYPRAWTIYEEPDPALASVFTLWTVNERRPVTCAMAAEETEDVHICECPAFVISGAHKGISVG
ncbi:hypothetical protein PIB30_009824 [Stylosanthes scabra]|uniref:Glycosyl-hydrolase family 116 N-terminal domain-containing protein n=1 Tax=Stylosanthes scabra TaxID=79078 RepID=A0ABU6Z603_9FABA|nr:hypothetical protein [Stylosanthes scabra]